MSLKLNFTKTSLLSFTRNQSGGSAKFSSAPSAHVIKRMGWSEPPEWQKSACAGALLKTSTFELVPGQGDLAKHAVELAGVNVIRDFEFVKKQVKKGKGAAKAPTWKTELHYSVDYDDPSGARKLEAYFQCGASDGTLTVTYEPVAEQDALPLDDAQEELPVTKQARERMN